MKVRTVIEGDTHGDWTVLKPGVGISIDRGDGRWQMSGKLRAYGEDGSEIGLLEWSRRPGSVLEVHLDVVPSQRRKGVGRRLVEDAERLAVREGCVAITTMMAGDNYKAQRFFQALGFVLTFVPSYYGTGRNAYFGVKPLVKP